jgi:putative ABC transport system permease protein
MGILLEWVRRLWGAIRRSPRDLEMEEELRLHLELASEEMRRRGYSPDDAARAARLQAGGIAQAIEAMRDQRGLPWLDDLMRDLRQALRSLQRTPAFTAVALLTLALGIGANTAIFTVVRGVILRQLEYPKSEQLMHLTAPFPALGLTNTALSAPEYLEFRQMNKSFAEVGSYTTGEINLMAGDRPLRARSISVDAHLLRTLGIQPAQGRFFSDAETELGMGGLAVAILSYELWQNAFGGQPLIGKRVSIDGRLHEILGIMPPGVDLMDHHTNIWLPLGLVKELRDARTFHTLHVIGRLKDGIAGQAAQTELNAFLENWSERTGASGHVPTNHSTAAADHTLRIQALQDVVVGDASRSIWVLQIAVGFVLLIACANLANLLMGRAASRRREFAVRAALGASGSRLLRQMMAESVLLSGAGGMLGVWLASIGVHGLIFAFPKSMPRTSAVAIDLPVLLFAVGVSIATGVLFGLAPLAQGRSDDLMTELKNSGDRSIGAGHPHIRQTLVVSEVALAVMLVIGAGLLSRTVYNLTSVDAGFDRSHLVTFSITLAEPYDPDTRAPAYQRILDKLRAIPGVQSATAMSGLPPNRSPDAIPTAIENYTPGDGKPVEVIDYYQFVMGDYFSTLGVPIVAGRGFEPTDIGSKSSVVVVNETLAKRIWSGQDPIGQRLRLNLSYAIGFGGHPWHTVIGVAKDVKQGGLEKETGTELYVSLDQVGLAAPTLNVALRTTLTPPILSGTLQRLVREVDPSVPIVRLRDMDSVFAESIRRPRLLAFLLGAFAGLALLLAAVGTYGVLSYMVVERRQEIGIRIALGAGRAGVFALVMKHGLQLTIIGIVAGVSGAFSLNELIASMLFGVKATDSATVSAVIATTALVAAAACGVPAWRASRLDPNVLLKQE